MQKKKLDKAISSEVVSDLEKFEFFFGQYWKQIMFIAGIAAVLAMLGFGAWKFRQNSSSEANTALTEAKTEKALIAALEKYPDESAAAAARLRLAAIYMEEAKFDLAIRQFQLLASNKKFPGEMRYRAELDRAYLMEQTGNTAEAIELFKHMGQHKKVSENISSEAYYSAGRLLLAEKKHDEARKYLKKAQAVSSSSDNPFTVSWAKMAALLESSIE